MKKLFLVSIALSALVLWAVSCGGGGGNSAPTAPSNSNPAPPVNSNPAPPASATVNIVGSAGSGAFSPNPVQVPSGGTIEWKNSTSDVHSLVMNDGTSIGTLAPGASLTTSAGAGGAFRCVNHPSMVGSINGAIPNPPGDTNPDDPYDY